jgi:cytochrome c oxidase subunit II
MIMAVVLIVIVAAALLFHLISPWWTTPLASNWGQMDDMLTVTLVITGIFFVGINLFLAWMLVRFRHREPVPGAALHATGHTAAYLPENKKLERWLIIGTGVAIMILLAPGLLVYAAYVKPPTNALILEVLGQQWQWRYRFAGADGKLGVSSVGLVSAANPFGLSPADPVAQNNILITGGEVHLPLGRPVKFLFRSNDVLHDFYVPQFRARMNMVPGMVTSFWLTPTRAGKYEVMCAQLCGLGHANMRSYVVVESEAEFQRWLHSQPSFATMLASANASNASAASPGSPAAQLIAQGQALAQSKACVACHSVDGSASVGPTWKGLFGKTETMADGSTAQVDTAYLQAFIRDPQSRVIKGFAPIMPKIEMSDAELTALIAYIQSYGVATAEPATPASGTAATAQK